MHNHHDDYRIGSHGAIVGIGVNTALFIFKFFAGIFGRSHAMLADALHTATDSLTSIGVLIGFKIAEKPADAQHPYGHGRAESISAKLVSLVLILGGFKVAYDSMKVIILQEFTTPHQIALWAAVLSIIIKEGLFRYTHRLGKRIDSSSLKADAWHHRSDALSSIAALIGITGARLGFPILDPLAGFIVSIFVVKAGLGLFRTAYEELMDAALPRDMIKRIEDLALDVEGVKRVKDIKGRKMGIEIFIDMTIEVDKDMTVSNAHTITSKIKRSVINDVHSIKDILVHVEPYEKEMDS